MADTDSSTHRPYHRLLAAALGHRFRALVGLEQLEARASGPKWEIPVEVRVHLKAVARHRACENGEEPLAYSQEEIEALHEDDLEIVGGGGLVGHLQAGQGWTSPESLELLDEWEKDARSRLERIEDSEPLEAVYGDG